MATPARPLLHTLLTPALLCLATGLATYAQAGEISVLVKDRDGKPMPDAVATLYPIGKPIVATPLKKPVVVIQENLQFSPFLTVIPVGTKVVFPNRDRLDHHLKSFSPTKPFEFRTYSKGETPPELVFDKAGPVTLNCNFHGWMRANIFVTDTPYTANTGEKGQAAMLQVPDGEVEVKLWHPDMLVPVVAQRVKVSAGTPTVVTFNLDYVPRKRPAPRPPPPANSGNSNSGFYNY